MTWTEFEDRVLFFISEIEGEGYFSTVDWHLTRGAAPGEPFSGVLRLRLEPGREYFLPVTESPDLGEPVFELPGERFMDLSLASLYCRLWQLEAGRAISLSPAPAAPVPADPVPACDLCGGPLRDGRCQACGNFINA